jgi:hypothetical protein
MVLFSVQPHLFLLICFLNLVKPTLTVPGEAPILDTLPVPHSLRVFGPLQLLFHHLGQPMRALKALVLQLALLPLPPL